MKRIKTLIISGAMLMAIVMVGHVSKAQAAASMGLVPNINIGEIATVHGANERVSAGVDAFKVYDASGKYWGKLICTFAQEGNNFIMTDCKLELSNGTVLCDLQGGVPFAPIPMGDGEGLVAFESPCTGTGNLNKVINCVCRVVFDLTDPTLYDNDPENDIIRAVLGTCYLMEKPIS